MQAVWISLSAFSSGLRLRKDVCGGNEELVKTPYIFLRSLCYNHNFDNNITYLSGYIGIQFPLGLKL